MTKRACDNLINEWDLKGCKSVKTPGAKEYEGEEVDVETMEPEGPAHKQIRRGVAHGELY